MKSFWEWFVFFAACAIYS